MTDTAIRRRASHASSPQAAGARRRACVGLRHHRRRARHVLPVPLDGRSPRSPRQRHAHRRARRSSPRTRRSTRTARCSTALPFVAHHRQLARASPIVARSLQLITSAMAAYAFGRLPFRGHGVVFAHVPRDHDDPVAGAHRAAVRRDEDARPASTPTSALLAADDRLGVRDLPAAAGGRPRARTSSTRRRRSTAPATSGSSSQIMLPLIRPALATLAVFAFMGSWNSFLWPLVVHRARPSCRPCRSRSPACRASTPPSGTSSWPAPSSAPADRSRSTSSPRSTSFRASRTPGSSNRSAAHTRTQHPHRTSYQGRSRIT